MFSSWVRDAFPVDTRAALLDEPARLALRCRDPRCDREVHGRPERRLGNLEVGLVRQSLKVGDVRHRLCEPYLGGQPGLFGRELAVDRGIDGMSTYRSELGSDSYAKDGDAACAVGSTVAAGTLL